MDKKRSNLIESLSKRRARKRLLRRVAALGCVVVLLATLNTLKFRAVAMEHVADCGYEDHVHTAECYGIDGSLVCQRHVHTDACYQTAPVEEAESESPEILEDLPDEVEITLGGEEAAEDEAPQADGSDMSAEPETEGYTYDLGENDAALLSDIVEVGDFKRFATAQHFASYLGLVPGEDSSGEGSPSRR